MPHRWVSVNHHSMSSFCSASISFPYLYIHSQLVQGPSPFIVLHLCSLSFVPALPKYGVWKKDPASHAASQPVQGLIVFFGPDQNIIIPPVNCLGQCIHWLLWMCTWPPWPPLLFTGSWTIVTCIVFRGIVLSPLQSILSLDLMKSIPTSYYVCQRTE